MSAIDNILNFKKDEEDFYAILGCDENSTVSPCSFIFSRFLFFQKKFPRKKKIRIKSVPKSNYRVRKRINHLRSGNLHILNSPALTCLKED